MTHLKDINVLRNFLNTAVIPEVKEKPKTFLSIAKQPHYENVISNLYAFFFNPNEVHGLKDLFINSLKDLIVEKIEESGIKERDLSDFTDFEIVTEAKTNNGGRIDLLLHNDNQAIIIENKIYHFLDNDLDDYWNTVKENRAGNIGVLLSLQPISNDQWGMNRKVRNAEGKEKWQWQFFEFRKEYVNITHIELITKIKGKALAYLLEADEKYQYLFKDFLQNIENISRPNMNEQDISFFVEKKKEINELVKLKYTFKKHIIAQVEEAANAIPNVKLDTPRSTNNNVNRLRYYRSTKQDDLVYTIVFENLLNQEGNLIIIVEPRGEALKNGASFKAIDLDSKEKEICRDDFFKETDNSWSHFARKSYHLKADEIANLSTFIQEKIKEDGFQSIMKKLENHLTEKVKRN